MAIFEDIHVSNVIQIEQVIFRNIYMQVSYIFMKQQLIKKEAMDLKES